MSCNNKNECCDLKITNLANARRSESAVQISEIVSGNIKSGLNYSLAVEDLVVNRNLDNGRNRTDGGGGGGGTPDKSFIYNKTLNITELSTGVVTDRTLNNAVENPAVTVVDNIALSMTAVDNNVNRHVADNTPTSRMSSMTVTEIPAVINDNSPPTDNRNGKSNECDAVLQLTSRIGGLTVTEISVVNHDNDQAVRDRVGARPPTFSGLVAAVRQAANLRLSEPEDDDDRSDDDEAVDSDDDDDSDVDPSKIPQRGPMGGRMPRARVHPYGESAQPMSPGSSSDSSYHDSSPGSSPPPPATSAPPVRSMPVPTQYATNTGGYCTIFPATVGPTATSVDQLGGSPPNRGTRQSRTMSGGYAIVSDDRGRHSSGTIYDSNTYATAAPRPSISVYETISPATVVDVTDCWSEQLQLPASFQQAQNRDLAGNCSPASSAWSASSPATTDQDCNVSSPEYPFSPETTGCSATSEVSSGFPYSCHIGSPASVSPPTPADGASLAIGGGGVAAEQLFEPNLELETLSEDVLDFLEFITKTDPENVFPASQEPAQSIDHTHSAQQMTSQVQQSHPAQSNNPAQMLQPMLTSDPNFDLNYVFPNSQESTQSVDPIRIHSVQQMPNQPQRLSHPAQSNNPTQMPQPARPMQNIRPAQLVQPVQSIHPQSQSSPPMLSVGQPLSFYPPATQQQQQPVMPAFRMANPPRASRHNQLPPQQGPQPPPTMAVPATTALIILCPVPQPQAQRYRPILPKLSDGGASAAAATPLTVATSISPPASVERQQQQQQYRSVQYCAGPSTTTIGYVFPNATENLRLALKPSYLNEACATINRETAEELQTSDYQDGDTKLHISTANGNREWTYALVERFKRDKLSIDKGNNIGQTPLFNAVARNDPLVVAYLLHNGADASCVCRDNNTPLHVVACSGKASLEVGRLLCRVSNSRIDVTNSAGLTPLHKAVMSHSQTVDSLPIVELLLQSGAKMDVSDRRNGKTALHMAVEQGSLELVDVLCRCCQSIAATIDFSTFTRDTALHAAARLNNVDEQRQIAIIEKLLKYGASRDFKNTENKYPKNLVDKERVKAKKLLQWPRNK